MPSLPYHCVCCIIPSRMLRQLADAPHLSNTERHCLLDQCELSAILRGQRSVMPTLAATQRTGEQRRTVYDGRHKTTLPGRVARTEGSAAVKDAAVNQAYDNAGLTYDFFRSVFQRNSVDNKGLRLDSTVHYQRNFNNAFWNG